MKKRLFYFISMSYLIYHREINALLLILSLSLLLTSCKGATKTEQQDTQKQPDTIIFASPVYFEGMPIEQIGLDQIEKSKIHTHKKIVEAKRKRRKRTNRKHYRIIRN